MSEEQPLEPQHIPPTPVLPHPVVLPEEMTELPAKIPPHLARQWNTGAFFLTPFWAGAMRLWGIVFGFLAIGVILSLIGMAIERSFGGGLFTLVYAITIARNGNALAYKSRRWKNIEQFTATQRVWAIWGWLSLVGQIVLLIIYATLMQGLL